MFFRSPWRLVSRSRSGQAIALLLILLTAAAAWPVAHYGHAAYDRVYAMSNGRGATMADWHEYLADRIVWVLLRHGGAGRCRTDRPVEVPPPASLALVLTRSPPWSRWALAGFLAFVGGKIRHSEFRDGPPPAWAHTSADEE